MRDSLAALEDDRSRLLLELAQVGDFRRGSIQSLFRRCGKSNCACAQAGHPGHGPVTRLAYKVRGKSVALTLSAPAQVRKAEREVAEVGSLLRVIVNARRKVGAFDLEALEQATRAALHRAGARLLEELLAETEDEGQPPLCTCGSPMRCEGPRPKRLVSLLGVVSLRRPYYHCRHCWRGAAPLDRELDIEGTQYSPGVRRLLAVVGGETPFARGRALLAELAGIAVSAKAVERQAHAIGSDLAARAESDRCQAALRGFPPQPGEPLPTFYIELDGTGIPVTAAASAGRQGKDGATARTREVKLGCIFTQTDLDAEGRPVRDARSTTYTGAIERTHKRSDSASTTRPGSAACTAPTARS